MGLTFLTSFTGTHPIPDLSTVLALPSCERSPAPNGPSAVPHETLELLRSIIETPAWTTHFMHTLLDRNATEEWQHDYFHLRTVVLHYYRALGDNLKFMFQVLLGIGPNPTVPAFCWASSDLFITVGTRLAVSKHGYMWLNGVAIPPPPFHPLRGASTTDMVMTTFNITIRNHTDALRYQCEARGMFSGWYFHVGAAALQKTEKWWNLKYKKITFVPIDEFPGWEGLGIMDLDAWGVRRPLHEPAGTEGELSRWRIGTLRDHIQFVEDKEKEKRTAALAVSHPCAPPWNLPDYALDEPHPPPPYHPPKGTKYSAFLLETNGPFGHLLDRLRKLSAEIEAKGIMASTPF